MVKRTLGASFSASRTVTSVTTGVRAWLIVVMPRSATACKRVGLKVGHLGHLVQIPRHEAPYAARKIAPDYWTVFSEIKQPVQFSVVAAFIKIGQHGGHQLPQRIRLQAHAGGHHTGDAPAGVKRQHLLFVFLPSFRVNYPHKP